VELTAARIWRRLKTLAEEWARSDQPLPEIEEFERVTQRIVSDEFGCENLLHCGPVYSCAFILREMANEHRRRLQSRLQPWRPALMAVRSAKSRPREISLNRRRRVPKPAEP
jgi:hypothetical protein